MPTGASAGEAALVVVGTAFWDEVTFYEIKLTANWCISTFQFRECGQDFIGAHNETSSVAAMRVCNPD